MNGYIFANNKLPIFTALKKYKINFNGITFTSSLFIKEVNDEMLF